MKTSTFTLVGFMIFSITISAGSCNDNSPAQPTNNNSCDQYFQFDYNNPNKIVELHERHSDYVTEEVYGSMIRFIGFHLSWYKVNGEIMYLFEYRTANTNYPFYRAYDCTGETIVGETELTLERMETGLVVDEQYQSEFITYEHAFFNSIMEVETFEEIDDYGFSAFF